MYGTHCSRCGVMEMKLKRAKIPFTYIDDQDKVVELGKANNINSMPIVVVDGKVMDFTQALEWLKGIEK